MAKITIRYFVARPKNDGTMRYYWQPNHFLRNKKWQMKRLSDDLTEAMAQAQDQNRAVDLWRAGMIGSPVNERPGTIDALIVAYKKSRHFTDKAERTRKDYAYYLDFIRIWAGDLPAAQINAKMITDLYEAQRTKSPRKAAYLIQVARLLFSFAERESLIPKNSNPATRPAIDYKSGKGKLWSHDDVRHFISTADAMGYFSLGTAVKLNEWIGQRSGDLISLSMRAYRDGVFYIRQNKTGAEVALPVDMVPDLKARLEEQIKQNITPSVKRRIVGTSLLQQRSRGPYTRDGFTSSFQNIKDEAVKARPQMKTLVFKDLRHTAVTRLAESGATIPQIAAITGHSFKTCEQIVDRYNIRTSAMAREAFQRRLDFDAIHHGEKI